MLLKPSKILFLFAVIVQLISCSKETNTTTSSLVVDCDTFEEVIPNLNSAPIDFECRGNAFLKDHEINDTNSEGSWGVFGGIVQLQYLDNPSVDQINPSLKVLRVVEDASNEPWSGFFLI